MLLQENNTGFTWIRPWLEGILRGIYVYTFLELPVRQEKRWLTNGTWVVTLFLEKPRYFSKECWFQITWISETTSLRPMMCLLLLGVPSHVLITSTSHRWETSCLCFNLFPSNLALPRNIICTRHHRHLWPGDKPAQELTCRITCGQSCAKKKKTRFLRTTNRHLIGKHMFWIFYVFQ